MDFDLAQQTAGSIKDIRQVGEAAAGLADCRCSTCAGPPLLIRTTSHRCLQWIAHKHVPSGIQEAAIHHTTPHPTVQPTHLPCTQWITNEYLHCGIREAGVTILEKLLNMARGGILLR